MADWYKASMVAPSPGSDEQLDDDDDMPMTSRRSPVVCRHACVATSQPLATSIGVDLLRRGANAADTAIAVAAALGVTEPCSTGLGGDMFCLYYHASTRKVSCINASGASPANLTLDVLKQACPDAAGGVDVNKVQNSAWAVTVPGAAQGFEDLLERHGSGQFTLAELVEPAAVLAEEGFPVAPITSHHWRTGWESQIRRWVAPGEPAPLTVDGERPPGAGEILVNAELARVLRDLGKDGAKKGFYQGKTGQAIVDAVQKHGGCLTMEDLAAHTSEYPDPIFAEYRGCKLWQVPPNGQGIAGLIALTSLQELEKKGIVDSISPDNIGTAHSYHAMMEMMRLGFADARAHVADPRYMKIDCATLLDPKRLGDRAEKLYDPHKAVVQGVPDASSCTISFQVVDREGNAISFVNSNFMGFGTGIVPGGCGFSLQNRGAGFDFVDPTHVNAVGPAKRPYHTIIPGMLTHADTDELYASLTNMGGNMQPQGHLQLTVDMLAGDLNPQEAIDLPRFCIVDGTQGGTAFMEAGIPQETVQELLRRGHKLKPNIVGHERSLFGRAQIIKRDRKTGVLWAGSDGRADGCAIGF